MKNLILACVTIGLSLFSLIQALPQGVTVETITVVPIPAAATSTASPFPQPTTNEFQYQNFNPSNPKDQGDEFIIHSAFLPFSPIIAATLQSIGDTNDQTIARWFPGTVTKNNNQDARVYVGAVFRRIFSAPSSPQGRVATWTANAVDWRGSCDADGKVKAYTVGSIYAFHVCQAGLNQPMIMDPANCSSFGENVDSSMKALSGTLVHEFMHMNSVGDQVDQSVGHITDVIYNPSNCFRMAHAASDVNRQKAFINADSYRWFATNAYYNSVCGKSFGDPVASEQDYEEGMAEAQASPEYAGDAALEGIFEGD